MALNYIIKWSQMNKTKMKFNNNKFELLYHKPYLNNRKLDLLKELPFFNRFFNYNVSENISISPSQSVKDLGVNITRDLSWNVHIDITTKKASRISRWILHVFYTRDPVTMITLFKTLVRPILEYCPEIWNPYKVKDIVSIEKVQRTFTSKIRGTKDLNYWERLKALELYSLQRRRERILILIVWKIRNGMYPNCVNFKFKVHKRSNSVKAVLKPMPRVMGSLLTKYEESFVIKAAKLWNVIPSNLTVIEHLGAFKSGLDRFLKTVPDLPPVPGYPSQTKNSLTDYIVR